MTVMTSINLELATQIETCEVNAWRDMYAAAPPEFSNPLQLEIMEAGNVTLTRCAAIPFIHFNCVMNLGMSEAARERQVDEILAIYAEAGVREFAFFHIPHSTPAELPEWLEKRGLQVRGGWDRIYRDNSPLAETAFSPQNDSLVEKVTRATAPEWSAFIDEVYGLPTTPWLLALVDRPGWHHYMLRQEGGIAAVRSMYLHTDGMAWLGIDAPVPGLMTNNFEPDARICEAIVRDGIGLGARYFVADIEAPSPEMDTPAYHNFEALGFNRPYFRSHYSY